MKYDNLIYRPFINRENGAHALIYLSDLYYMASFWETRGNKCRTRDLKDIWQQLKKKLFIGQENNSTGKG